MHVVLRCVASAAVGASVVLLWLAVLPLLPSPWLKLPCDPVRPGECVAAEPAFGPSLILATLVLVVVGLGWWLLGLLRVTGSQWIGLLGPALVYGLARILALVGVTAELPSVALAVVAAVAYLLAALLTERTLAWPVRLVAAGVLAAGALLGG